MILRDLLRPEIQQYIHDHTAADVRKLALAKNPFPGIAWTNILNQISARKKAATKLPTWFATKNIVYPTKISVEQTSSEATAQYKSNLVQGETLADLSGGFGVDAFYFSKAVDLVFHCETNPELQQIAAHNFAMLGAHNINSYAGDSLNFLKQSNRIFDWIFIDPSRRRESGRVFLLTDCEPNVPDLLSTYLKYSNNILIKAAPLLDITAALSELKNVRTIHAVAVDNDVKELLFEIENGFTGTIRYKTINLKKGSAEMFEFFVGEALAETGLPLTYLYEPNSAIMKSGGFEQIAIAFNIFKLHRHSHLYTSEQLRDDFPGRVFKIERQLPYSKSYIKKLQGIQANVTTRNFPESVDSIRKKLKIRDGGDTYCFFTTNINNEKIVLICSKIK